MLSSGDVADLDLGTPEGREAGVGRPAVIVTAPRILDADPSVIQVIPVTTTIRRFGSEVIIDPDRANGLTQRSAAQCQHLRSVSTRRVRGTRGNVGVIVLSQIRDTVAVILDLST